MPNHITNYIIPVTDDDKLKFEFLKSMGGKNGHMDFNSIIKMPDELKNTIAGSDAVVSDREYEAAVKSRQKMQEKNQGAFGGLPISKSMYEDYMERFGAANWHDWSLNNWDTKWNAYDIETAADYMKFDTAWSTPVNIFKTLSKKFPTLPFYVFYADEDIGSNCGVISCFGGKVIDEATLDFNDKFMAEAYAILIKYTH